MADLFILMAPLSASGWKDTENYCVIMYSLALISVAEMKCWAIMKCERASNVIRKVKI